MICANCQKPIAGSSDTFGDVHYPLCQECYFEIDNDYGNHEHYAYNCKHYPLTWPTYEIGYKPFTEGYQQWLG